jgi:hypothetical protein
MQLWDCVAVKILEGTSGVLNGNSLLAISIKQVASAIT